MEFHQVRGMGCLQKKPHRPPQCHRKANSRSLPFPTSVPCAWELPWAGGLCLLPTDTVPALLLKAFPAIFGQQVPFQIFALVLVPGPAHSWGSLPAPCCAELDSPSSSIPWTSTSRIPPLPPVSPQQVQDPQGVPSALQSSHSPT